LRVHLFTFSVLHTKFHAILRMQTPIPPRLFEKAPAMMQGQSI